MTQDTPIIVFGYNRPEHLQRVVEALQKNWMADETSIYFFLDGARDASEEENVRRVRTYARSVAGFKTKQITERPDNWGLARSILAGIYEVFRSHDRLIVLEDDLVAAPDFLTYIRAALDFYQDAAGVFSVTAFSPPLTIPSDYSYDAYLAHRCCSYAWGTWKDRWTQADWDIGDYARFRADRAAQRQFNRGGEDMSFLLDEQMAGCIDSWAIRWCYAHYRHDAFCVYPVRSKVWNIGADGSGTHTGRSRRFNMELDLAPKAKSFRFPRELIPDNRILASFHRFYSRGLKGRFMRWGKQLLRPLRSRR